MTAPAHLVHIFSIFPKTMSSPPAAGATPFLSSKYDVLTEYIFRNSCGSIFNFVKELSSRGIR